MSTPICDFVRRYAESEPVRFHMPGHKGRGTIGAERLDITEIDGADVLYAPEGIIRESEENASALFASARTLFSTEGSSLCIRAMVYLARIYAQLRGKKAVIAAGRNAHRVFLEAVALIDTDVTWLGADEELLVGTVKPEEVEHLCADPETKPTAVYITSPDYLGHRAEIAAIAEICHRYDVLLLVDNAHGAYLRFLQQSAHPLDQGADLCCDSAHKTLPVLTGGAYLHASAACPKELLPFMERAMNLFASTSPSWLTLQSLDAVNQTLAEGYREKIIQTADLSIQLRHRLEADGWRCVGDEPLKLTLCPKESGYTGTTLREYMAEHKLICEFADPDYVVLMITPELREEQLERLRTILHALPRKDALTERPPKPGKPHPVLRPHEVLFHPFERIRTKDGLGRILASPSVSCPPAVPICICGERIGKSALRMFEYYGIEYCDVISE